jgi:hypothetical protein
MSMLLLLVAAVPVTTKAVAEGPVAI